MKGSDEKVRCDIMTPMNSCQFPALSIFALMLLASTIYASAAKGDEAGCIQAGDAWVTGLDDPSGIEVLRRNVRSNCEFSGEWVKRSANVAEPARRERMCNDLVLIWTHKECGYFRDVHNPSAYDPCKAWSREMYRNCMENNVAWFP